MPCVHSKSVCLGPHGDGSGGGDAVRDEKRIEWVASDGGGWKALRLYTGECVRVCAERVTVASGTRRPLYALSEVVRAIECSDSAHKGKLQTWNAHWGRSCPENVRRCVYELPKQGRHGTKTKTVDFGGVEALVEAIDPDRLQDFNTSAPRYVRVGDVGRREMPPAVGGDAGGGDMPPAARTERGAGATDGGGVSVEDRAAALKRDLGQDAGGVFCSAGQAATAD
jgi:hypothetical protein